LLTNLYILCVCAELSAISRECVLKDLRDYVVLNSVDWDMKFSFVKLIISLTKRIVKKKEFTYAELKLTINSKSDDKTVSPKLIHNGSDVRPRCVTEVSI